MSDLWTCVLLRLGHAGDCSRTLFGQQRPPGTLRFHGPKMDGKPDTDGILAYIYFLAPIAGNFGSVSLPSYNKPKYRGDRCPSCNELVVEPKGW